MDNKRFLVAIALSIVVIFATQALFPPSRNQTTPAGQTDSVATPGVASEALSGASSATSGATQPETLQPSVAAETSQMAGQVASQAASIGAADSLLPPPVLPETTVFAPRTDSGATFTLSNIGATPVSVTMNAYFNRSDSVGRPVNLVAAEQLIKYQIVTNTGERIDLSTLPFQITEQNEQGVAYTANLANGSVTLRYTMGADGHTGRIAGSVTGLAGAYLVATLPETYNVVERDSSADINALSFSYHNKRDGSRSVSFRSLDPGETELVEGPVSWVAGKNKYFVVALLVPDSTTMENPVPFSEVKLVGGPRVAKSATHATADVVIPVTNGTFAFDFYAGPQEWKRLNALGRNFEEVNPYGWAWMRGVLQPIATGVIRLVIWMHNGLDISYGWVLILLGVIVRIVLWPLNQVAMRSSMKMQEIQPKIQEVQKRYKDNVQKQREEMMRVYSEEGMNPFSPLMGCLPMMLPMPVLFALFFVFQNTIEFRGVSFMWLNDLSAHDPIYLLPIIMAVSMYGLSMMSMRGTPPNPQAKMMMYFMPVMFLVFLGRAAAGLNLYYAAQNIAALPQQWLLTRERVRRQQAREAKTGKSTSVEKTTSKTTSNRKQKSKG